MDNALVVKAVAVTMPVTNGHSGKLHGSLVTKLGEFIGPLHLHACAPLMSVEELRSWIAGCEAEERRYAEAGFVRMDQPG